MDDSEYPDLIDFGVEMTLAQITHYLELLLFALLVVIVFTVYRYLSANAKASLVMVVCAFVMQFLLYCLHQSPLILSIGYEAFSRIGWASHFAYFLSSLSLGVLMAKAFSSVNK